MDGRLRQCTSSMSHTFTPIGVGCLLLCMEPAHSEIDRLRFGGEGGVPWADSTAMNLMVDDVSVPGALQPLQLKPDQNVVAQLHHWTRYREPIDHLWRPGMPRVWRGVGDVPRPGHGANPVDFIDGSLDTYWTKLDYLGRALDGFLYGEYYTFDLGLQIPAERFVLRIPVGNHSISGEPFRPNFAFDSYELTASNSVSLVENQVRPPGSDGGEAVPEYYQALDILLANISQNLDPDAEIPFPLQYLRFFRIKLLPTETLRLTNAADGISVAIDEPVFPKFALAELEVYGRGMVPQAVWESTVIDMERSVNVGQLFVGLSRWRIDSISGEAVSDSAAAAEARIQMKTGRDNDPVAYYSYNDLEHTVEVAEEEYTRLKNRVWPWDPPAVGWKGPIGQDISNWSFWSTPVRSSGERPRLPKGRYLKFRVELESEELWDYIRVDSLAVEVSPLLAARILGEVALAEELRPDQGQAIVQAGQRTEFVYDVGAEFEGGELGFDAVRVMSPASAELLEVRFGEDLNLVALERGEAPPDPECGCATWFPETQGFVVHLPQRINPAGEHHLRLKLQTAVYGVTGEIAADAIDLSGAGLPQSVEAGDVSEELGTNQLRVLTTDSSLGGMLGPIKIDPSVVSPQGDGVNEETTITYTLFRVLESARVDVSVYTLSGQRVWSGSPGRLGGGSHTLSWDGRDAVNQLVAPGVYLLRVEVETDAGREARVRPVAVAY